VGFLGFRRRIRTPVRGTAEVIDSSATTLTLVVKAEGVIPFATEHRRAPGDPAPRTGALLPVTVDRDDPTRLRVEWDETGQ
jgi:hypothetical protein